MDDRMPLARELLTLSDAECAERLRVVRYGGPHPPVCPRCGTCRFSRVPGKPRVDRCLGCHTDVSVTAGTALHGLKGPLARVFAALVLLTRRGSISTRQLALLFGVQWKSAAALAHKLRVALAADVPELSASTARVTACLVRLRFEPGERPPKELVRFRFPPQLATVAVIDPDTNRMVLDVARQDRELVATRLVERVLPGVEKLPWPDDIPRRLYELGHVLARTHRQVSRRWIRVYLGGLTWTPRDAADDGLGAVVRAPARTWRTIRPPRHHVRGVWEP